MDVARLVVRVGANITELERGLSEARRRVREFAGQRVEDGDLGRSLERIGQEAREAGQQVREFAKQRVDLDLGRSLQRLGQGAREAGQRLALGVTAPLMGLGAAVKLPPTSSKRWTSCRRRAALPPSRWEVASWRGSWART